MKIYLDNCCYNRPFDDQSSILVRMEAEAKLFIQELVKTGKLNLIWSFVLDYENSKNPFIEKREQIVRWRSIAKIDCVLNQEIQNKAHELQALGLSPADAAYIACAVSVNAARFITTERNLQNFSFASSTAKKRSFVGHRPKNCKSLCKSNRLLQEAPDKGILNKVINSIRVVNPITFLQEYLNEN